MRTFVIINVLFLSSCMFISSSVEAIPIEITTKPIVLLMDFVGGGVNDSQNTQDSSKWYVVGSDVNSSEVFIGAYRTSSFDGIYFEDTVLLNESFLIDVTNIGESNFASSTYINIYSDSTKASLLQEIQFHTSLSTPLNVGDQFGAIQIAGYIDENGMGTSPPLPAPVPEPATMLLFGTGLVGLAGARYRKKKG